MIIIKCDLEGSFFLIGPMVPLPVIKVTLNPPFTTVAVFIGMTGTADHFTIFQQFYGARIPIEGLVKDGGAWQGPAETIYQSK